MGVRVEHGDEQLNGATTAKDDESDGSRERTVNGAGTPENATARTGAAAVTGALAAEGEPAVEASPETSRAQSGPTLLNPDTRLDGYVVERVLRATPTETVYLARAIPDEEVEDSPFGAPPPDLYVTITEREEGGFTAAARLVRLGLHHPRLLAPLAVHTRHGHDYLIVEARVNADGELAPTVSQGARLPAAGALTACAGLADALSYLHRNSVAHLHVTPDVVTVYQGRAFLGGLETAEDIGGGELESESLFARDANFLARTLGVLADTPTTGPDEERPREALRQIVAHGEASGFAGPEQLAASCASGVQATPILPTSASASARIALLYGSATSVGRVRSENQDASASALFDVHDDQAHGVPLGVFLVADGMGGEAHGELASRIAARTTVSEFIRNFALPLVVGPAMRAIDDAPELGMEESPAERLGRALARAVEAANRQVRNLARKLEQTTGTTMTALAIYGARAAIAHVGDSRAYVLRGDRMVQLTDDHSVLARLQAMDHPLLSDPDVFVPRSMLYRSLGQEDDTGPDTLDFTLAPGDRFLLCSDGLWDDLDPQVIAHTLAEATDPGDCGDALVALANDAGGSDNSTAVVIFARAITEEDRDDETESADTTPLDARASAPAEEA